jgi:DNA gyrase inhibitor GyrI
MSELDVRIVRLDPMRVAVSHGFGPSPEGIAWDKLRAWIGAAGLRPEEHRFFGFNNPDPSPGSPNYGYEQWITVGPDIQPEGDIKIKAFGGGLYAVTRCKLPQIGETWKQLVTWRDDSPYKCGHHQWLEECISPIDTPFDDLVMDIYLPISE